MARLKITPDSFRSKGTLCTISDVVKDYCMYKLNRSFQTTVTLFTTRNYYELSYLLETEINH